MRSNLTLLLNARLALLLLMLSPWCSLAFAADHNSVKNFVGSEACRDCHESIYIAWRTTFHSFSMRTPEQARVAQLPLPPFPSASTSTKRQWPEISAVFGGRNRLAYIDQNGDVIQPSFDARLQRWDHQFPNGHISSCWRCHATGDMNGVDNAKDYSGHGLELTIGCESCHGAGSRHIETFEPDDIVVDTGSRSCGRCHTGVGRVLPAIDSHQTHDFVQQWHADPHVRGLADFSVSAHCATCHSPADAHQPRPSDASRLVFSDRKRDIGCSACHDPHRMTNPAYNANSAADGTARATALSVLGGRDGDFTTSDHESFTDTESNCRACHRGADRVALNHGDATCVDCHSAFRRSKGPETPVVADPNHTRLSCRGCHSNGDHLLTIVAKDPRFLFAKIVHDLDQLPARAREDFELSGASFGTRARDTSPQAEAVGTNAANFEKLDLTEVIPQPGALRGDILTEHLRAAVAALDDDRREVAVTTLMASAKLNTSNVLLALPFDNQNINHDTVEAQTLIKRLQSQSLPLDEATQAWLDALGASLGRDILEVIRIGDSIEAAVRGPSLETIMALAKALRGDARGGVRLLETEIDGTQSNSLRQVSLALLEYRRKRHALALAHLDTLLASDATDAVAHYVRGLVLADLGEYSRAANAINQAVSVIPQWRDAWLKLGYVLIRAQETNLAIRVLQRSAAAWPHEHAMRYRLGSLYKLLADQMRYQLIAAREAPRPQGMTIANWRLSLDNRTDRIHRIASLAHAEYTYAQQLRPNDHRTRWQRAEALRLMGRYSDSLRLFETLAAREPNQWTLKYRAGMLQLELARSRQAVATLTAAHRVRPDQADVLAALGYAYLQLDEPTLSREHLELARVFEPFNPAIHHNLGVAYVRLNAPADAERVWQRGLELGTFPLPRVHLTHFNLAVLYSHQDELDKARLALERALFYFPDFEPALLLLESIQNGIKISAQYVLHEQSDLFGEISTVSGFDLAP